MHAFQISLVKFLGQDSVVDTFMRSTWGWPIVESLHFFGLCLLVCGVGFFDLRLLGIGRRIPIAAAHRLIPWGLLGFAINMSTGAMFVMTEPDQYIYNSSFHFKLLFIVIAGLNAGMFYLTSYRRLVADNPERAPTGVRVIAAVSLAMWIGVIIGGRLITFYRPVPCVYVDEIGMLLTCAPD